MTFIHRLYVAYIHVVVALAAWCKENIKFKSNKIDFRVFYFECRKNDVPWYNDLPTKNSAKYFKEKYQITVFKPTHAVERKENDILDILILKYVYEYTDTYISMDSRNTELKSICCTVHTFSA